MCNFERNYKSRGIYLRLAIGNRLLIIKCCVGGDIFDKGVQLGKIIWEWKPIVDIEGFFCSCTYLLPNIHPDFVLKANFCAILAYSWVLSGHQNLLENFLVQKLPGPSQKTSIISLMWGQDFAFTNKFPCAATSDRITSEYQWNPESVGLTGEWGYVTTPSCK